MNGLKRKLFFIETPEDLCGLIMDPNKRIVVLSQTTQDQEFVDSASAAIAKKYPHAEVIDSICLTTHHRQSEIKQLAQENDLILTIGSPESANSTRLWEIASRLSDNSHFIQRSADIEEEWLSGVKSVAITAGASTPRWIIDSVIEFLEK